MTLLNVQEAARRLRISKEFVYKLVRADELPHVRIGDRILFDEADLAAYIDQCRSAPRLETAALR